MRIEDDVELVAVPQENKRPIPICIEELPRYNMGVQHASHGCPQAHYSSHCINHHTKQTGYSPYPRTTSYYLDEALSFPSQQGLCQGTWHWGDSPVRPRGNPQPQGVLLLVYFDAY